MNFERKLNIERVCFNFLSGCKFHCDFCFCPKIPHTVDVNRCHLIIDRCYEIGAKIITFGGSDPFVIPGVKELIVHSNNLGLLVHVDCTGSELDLKDLEFLSENVKMIGLPLDGASPEMQAIMRGLEWEPIFHKIINLLNVLSNSPVKLKINTVLSAINFHEINMLAPLLRNFKIDTWSIYQYWPFLKSYTANERHCISDELFKKAISKILEIPMDFNLEASLVNSRLNTYFFVSHHGDVYIPTQDNPSDYNFLGSIFDSKSILSWSRLVNVSLRSSARLRYHSVKARRQLDDQSKRSYN